MAYRNKQETIKEAERLGIDVSGMDWPTMQKTVKTALQREELGFASAGDKAPKATVDKLKPYLDKTIRIAPEMHPDANRIIRYQEKLGDDLDIEEKHFQAGGSTEYVAGRDYTTGTFHVKGKTGRQVIAESSLPKENAQIVFRPGIDWFPVVTFGGRSGYLYTHQRFPNFKQVLMSSGYYEDYKDKLKDEPNVFYLTGLLCVDPSVAHGIMQDIELREKQKQLVR